MANKQDETESPSMDLPSSTQHSPTSAVEEAEALESSIVKLVQFLRNGRKNSKAVSVIFCNQNTGKGGGSQSSLSEPISIDKLLKGMATVGLKLNEAEGRSFRSHLDRNLNGLVTFNEFRDILATDAVSIPQYRPMLESSMKKLVVFLEGGGVMDYLTTEVFKGQSDETLMSGASLSFDTILRKLSLIGLELTPGESEVILAFLNKKHLGRLNSNIFLPVISEASKYISIQNRQHSTGRLEFTSPRASEASGDMDFSKARYGYLAM